MTESRATYDTPAPPRALTPRQRRGQAHDALDQVPDAALEPVLWVLRQLVDDPYDPEFWAWLAEWAGHQARQNGGNGQCTS